MNTQGPVVKFLYTNHRGELRSVRVAPGGSVWFGSTEHYPQPQALFTAWDLDREAPRTYALAFVHAWNFPAPEEGEPFDTEPPATSPKGEKDDPKAGEPS